MQTSLGRNCVAVQLPIGEEQQFKGVIDLVAMKAFTFADDGSGKVTEGDDSGRPRRRRQVRARRR